MMNEVFSMSDPQIKQTSLSLFSPNVLVETDRQVYLICRSD
jgi:hypothetical protein